MAFLLKPSDETTGESGSSGSRNIDSLQRPSSATGESGGSGESGESNMLQISSVSDKKLIAGNQDFARIIQNNQKVVIVQNVTGNLVM